MPGLNPNCRDTRLLRADRTPRTPFPRQPASESLDDTQGQCPAVGGFACPTLVQDLRCTIGLRTKIHMNKNDQPMLSRRGFLTGMALRGLARWLRLTISPENSHSIAPVQFDVPERACIATSTFSVIQVGFHLPHRALTHPNSHPQRNCWRYTGLFTSVAW
jgi:hypothetical protein